MSNVTTKQIQIQIVRDGQFYFYNRTENGRMVVLGQRISAERARAIYEANETELTSGTVTFAPGSFSWSWTSRAEEVA